MLPRHLGAVTATLLFLNYAGRAALIMGAVALLWWALQLAGQTLSAV
jgi:hypothetical protein